MGKKDKTLNPPPEPTEPSTPRSWGPALDALLAEVAQRFPGVVRRDGRLVDEPALLVEPSGVVELAGFLKSNEILPLNCCRAVTGIDKVDRFEVVYNLAHVPVSGGESDAGFQRIALVVVIGERRAAHTPSLVSLWPSADFQEREVFDLLGIEFDGHPDLRRILLQDEFIGHPLRKDYPLIGRWDDMTAIGAYLDENQVRTMKEASGRKFDPEKDVPRSFKR